MPADAMEQSPEAAARDMIERAARRVVGCCGATSETWLAGRLVSQVCAHPDLGVLMAAEPALPDSPMRAAARTLRPVRIQDTLTDRLWRPFSARALALSVRSLVSVARATGEDEVVTCTLYSLRPGGLGGAVVPQADQLLLEWVTTLAQATAFALAQAEARQMSEAIAARELVEQAKGMLMHALGCDAETAYQELVAAAARAQLRITDVARRMVEHRAAPARTPAARPVRRRSAAGAG